MLAFSVAAVARLAKVLPLFVYADGIWGCDPLIAKTLRQNQHRKGGLCVFCPKLLASGKLPMYPRRSPTEVQQLLSVERA
jgi:hypothetical protein